MTPKARRLQNHLSNIAISVDELFAAAFFKPLRIYQRESLLGWRPVATEATYENHPDEEMSFAEPGPQFSNSPDVKIRETADTIIIEVELPDIDEESLYLEVSGDLLIIKAEKTTQGLPRSGNGDTGEPDLIHRYVKLPVPAIPGNIKARLDGPLLRIKINKSFMGDQNKDPIKR